MRLRWIAIAAVLMFSVIGVYAVCHDQGGAVDTIVGMARRITFGALYATGFIAASYVLRNWMSQPIQPARQTLPPPPPLPEYSQENPNGPGRYRVHGFDRDTKFETTEFVYADSPSNAQFKVELKGVQVAAVQRA